MTSPIDTLTDEQAITVLTLVLDHQQLLPDPTQLQELDAHITEAATQPLHTDTSAGLGFDAVAGDTSDGPATPGALARDTLTHLAATRPGMGTTIEQAITLADQEITAPTKLDPITATVGALIVLALQTDLQIERGTNQKWRFKIHKKAMSDTTLAKLLSKLIATYTGGNSA